MYRNVFSELLGGNFGVPLLALLLLGFISFWLRYRQMENPPIYARYYVAIPAGLLIAVALCQLTSPPWTTVPLLLIDPENGQLPFLLLDMALWWTMWIVIKYRHDRALMISWCLLGLSYLPVLGFDGWHYYLGGAFFRSVYWASFLPVAFGEAWTFFNPLPASVLPTRIAVGRPGLAEAAK